MNMKRNKKWIGIGLIILLLGGGITYYQKMNLSGPYRLEVMQGEGGTGFGYQIYKGKRVIIAQPFIPAIAGRKTFRTEQDARHVGDLVLQRIRTGQDFAVSKEDLKGLGITH